ncbi:translation elongation factor Ts [Anabaena sp. FACHB-709]|uniref:Elongation factor Ts n=3 Tax=Nostocaceae TaxID=1162 RepID=EFTS_NOSS1|nr:MULTISPECIES: translation elongation factor Ts [Nostocaceae]Q8YMY3.1 RecName: Full=Elongation factor Ts; Short=EF-Ts [Nostoc sp. PCC 7120 = FACHB-418]BAY70397.1 translation elongation factor Ts [Trichormus variabilis NIES-23]HBW29001.1 elongation factor Ts [Nostoc sp. UBA8866]MBD2174333.1 elongation factor Ts [Anabaena cylindrica FACHB-318]MBD2266051.1 elongation factor Ts [Anabaena sp. FACHB-709]MBD2275425.1 elongation factor Ts [Nostoc sp. PCC 7120 = FACHB-418]
MAEISAKLVQELRQKTGAGMMDCKKALKETEGDVEQAIDWLRKKGIASAGKKSDRIAAEGLVDTYIQPGGKVGVLIEVNCQTDFVARNDAFKTLVKNLAQQAATADSVESLLAQPYIEDANLTVDEAIKQTIANLGENIQVRRFINFALTDKTGVVDSYIHTGGRVGVLVELNSQSEAGAANEEVQNLARNAAMQVAACPNVEYVSVDQIPAEVVQREKDVESGKEDIANKPENIREKIVQGRIEKRLKELTLVDQPYIRDQSISVEDLVKQVKAKAGEEVEVSRFVRYILGEGIEKQESNFAEEVAAQMGVK